MVREEFLFAQLLTNNGDTGMDEVRSIIFQLLKESLFPDLYKESALTGGFNWKDVFLEMQQQTVDMLPGEWLKKNSISDLSLQEKWIERCTLQKGCWVQVMYAQTELLNLLEENGIKSVIIKGAAAAMAYPQPSLRTVGDIDFLVSRVDYEKAARLLEENGYLLLGEKDKDCHHYKYTKNRVIFELHRRLAIIPETDEKLISLFEDGINHRKTKRVGAFMFPVLPSKLNGLVLIFHINQHLRSGLGLRHIIDWMMYLNERGGMQDLMPLLKKTKMERLANTITVLCQRYLGLREFVPDFEEYPCEQLMEYIFTHGNFGRKGANEGKISSFVLVSTNPVLLFRRLQKGGMLRWKAARKHKILHPIAWVYQVGRIIRQLYRNRITPIKLIKLQKIGEEQRDLILDLGLDIDRTIKEI